MGEIERKLFTRHGRIVCTLVLAKRELVREWNPDGPSNKKQWPSEKQKDHPSWTGPAPRSPIDFNYELPGHKRNLNITDKFEKFHNWFPRRLCRSTPLPFEGTRTVKGMKGGEGAGMGREDVRGQNEERGDKNKGTLHSRMSDRKDWRFSFRDILQRTDTFVSASTFFFSLLARSASIPASGLKGNSYRVEIRKETARWFLCVCVCFSKRIPFKYFTIGCAKYDRAKDLSRRKETIESF